MLTYCPLSPTQFQDPDFGGLSGGRVVRIAVHPDYQGVMCPHASQNCDALLAAAVLLAACEGRWIWWYEWKAGQGISSSRNSSAMNSFPGAGGGEWAG